MESIIQENQMTEQTTHLIASIQPQTFQDRAYGCIVGAFLGDACGAYVEFSGEYISDKIMDRCMEMPNNGTWKGRKSGQITDDSEMAMALMWALITPEKQQGKSQLYTEEIAHQYKNWILSQPFDLGSTTKSALGQIHLTKKNLAGHTRTNAAENNKKSVSNGSLMRCTPMIVWAASLSQNDFKAAIDRDREMTHPNQIVEDAQYLYGLAIQHLLLNPQSPNRAIEAFEIVKSLAETMKEQEDIFGVQSIKQWVQYAEDMDKYHDEFKDPLVQDQNKEEEKTSEMKIPKLDATKAQGWLKHSFILSLYFLLRFQKFVDTLEKGSNFYQHVLRQTIQQGGDTDTNACIVGGMVGALLGFSQLPQQMTKILLTCDSSEKGPLFEFQHFVRPDFLSTRRHLIPNIERLINNRCQPEDKFEIRKLKRYKPIIVSVEAVDEVQEKNQNLPPQSHNQKYEQQTGKFDTSSVFYSEQKGSDETKNDKNVEIS